MDPTLVLVAYIVELIAKYGVPAAIQIIQTWQIKDDPTLEDIQALKAMVPDAETYFKPKS